MKDCTKKEDGTLWHFCVKIEINNTLNLFLTQKYTLYLSSWLLWRLFPSVLRHVRMAWKEVSMLQHICMTMCKKQCTILVFDPQIHSLPLIFNKGEGVTDQSWQGQKFPFFPSHCIRNQIFPHLTNLCEYERIFSIYWLLGIWRVWAPCLDSRKGWCNVQHLIIRTIAFA